MKKYFLLLLIFISASLFAQENLEKKTINGKEFYIYSVSEGEGIYSVSKQFNVSQEEIIQYNSQAIGGIKKGMKLNIPAYGLEKKITTVAEESQKEVKKTTTNEFTVTKAQTAEVPVNTDKFIFHKVEKKQTIYSISKQYDISQETLIENNPIIKEGLKEGIILKIPRAAKTITESSPVASQPIVQPTISSDGFILHQVQPKETIFGISKKYNVSTSDIFENNNIEDGLKIGQTLRIPQKKSVSEPTQQIKNTKPTTTESPKAVPTDASKATTNPVLPASPLSRVISTNSVGENILKVALLLPFQLDAPSSDAKVDNFVEFYEGIIIALKKLKSQNISVELSVIDTEKSGVGMKNAITKNPQLKNVHFIIGPVYPQQVKIASDFAKEHKIPIIIPFAPNIGTSDQNPYLYQFNTQASTKFEDAANQFAKEFANHNIVLVTFNNSLTDVGSEFEKYISVILGRKNIPFQKIAFRQDTFSQIENALSINKKNIVMLATQEDKIIQDILPKIAELNSAATNVSIYGFDKWNSHIIGTLAPTYYHSAFFLDRSTQAVREYNGLFKFEFGYPVTKSPRYDLIGYDLMMHFATAFHNGALNTNDLAKTSSGLQSKIEFKRCKSGAYLNAACQIVKVSSTNGKKTFSIVE